MVFQKSILNLLVIIYVVELNAQIFVTNLALGTKLFVV